MGSRMVMCVWSIILSTFSVKQFNGCKKAKRVEAEARKMETHVLFSRKENFKLRSMLTRSVSPSLPEERNNQNISRAFNSFDDGRPLGTKLKPFKYPFDTIAAMDRKQGSYNTWNVRRLSNVWVVKAGKAVVKLKQMAIFIAHKTQHAVATIGLVNA